MTARKLNIKVGENQIRYKVDWNFLAVIVTIQIVGLIALYSADHATGHSGHFFKAQMKWLGIGWVAFLLMARVNYRTLINFSGVFYGINLVALALVPFVGKTVNGSKRWINLVFFNYQPSETMKIMVFLFLTSFLARTRLENLTFKDLILPTLFIAFPFVFTFLQPDLGTALLMAAVPATLLIFLKLKPHVLISLVSIFAISIPAFWSSGLIRPYQKKRVMNFISPDSDPRGTGYNSIQAKIAIGSGQFLGKGFLQGSQSQLEFLPERHSDFIFCVLTEEFGFIGALMALALFFSLIYLILKTAQNSPDRKGALLCIGVAAFIFWHMLINIGMVAGLLPIVGVPLPLMSYGGSSLLSIMVSLGLVASVSRRKYLF